jgi:hypothetical protein
MKIGLLSNKESNDRLHSLEYTPEKFDAFRAAVFGFFEKIDSYQSELASLLTQKFHIINS